MPRQSRMADVIRRPPVMLSPAATVQEACRAMHAHNVGAVLITDRERHLLGIFSGRDVVRLLAEGRNPAHMHLDAAMTRDPAHLPEGQDARQAVALMEARRCRHLPLVAQGVVVAVVSVGDQREGEDRLDQITGIWQRR